MIQKEDNIEVLFQSPEIKAYCHLCNVAFKSLEDILEHNRKYLNKHQRIMASRLEEKNASKKGKVQESNKQ